MFTTKAQSPSQINLVEATRLIIWYTILALGLLTQATNLKFIYLEALLPLLSIAAIAFFLNLIFLLLPKKNIFPSFLFMAEVLLLTAAIRLSGINYSLFLFMYLVNIILCGFIFGRKAALFLASLTSLSFSYILVIDLSLTGQNLLLSLVFNNAAYFSVALLSGYLGEQLSAIRFELRFRTRNLKKLQHINSLIVENMPVGLITTDLKGEILQNNQSANDILGQKHFTKTNLFDLIPELQKHVSLVMPSDTTLNTWKFDLAINQINDKRIFSFVINRFIDPLENGERLIFLFEDQTKIRKLEYAVRQNEKMAAIGQLAAGIAHEIRNPLASISGSIQMLKANANNEDDRRLMAIILRETDRLNGLISEFLEYSRPDQPAEDSVNLNALIQEVMEVVRINKALRNDVIQRADLQARGNIIGNREKLKQALLNIVINAYQAMTDVPSPLLSVSTEELSGQVLLRIKDSGCGMDEALRKRIFEPFMTTKPKGTGLGLAVTHKILENHGARIFVESEPGMGTEFMVEFPVAIKAIN